MYIQNLVTTKILESNKSKLLQLFFKTFKVIRNIYMDVIKYITTELIQLLYDNILSKL